MGDELRVARGTPLVIEASARLNPEFDRLDRLELVVLGDVAATAAADGTDAVTLSHEMAAEGSLWIAVRAWGGRQEPRDMTVAHSAPIYVVVGDEPTWKREGGPGAGRPTTARSCRHCSPPRSIRKQDLEDLGRPPRRWSSGGKSSDPASSPAWRKPTGGTGSCWSGSGAPVDAEAVAHDGRVV